MKTANDPRHQRRITLMQRLFASSFQREKTKEQNLSDIADHLLEIDERIQLAAPEWPISKISRIDLAILRLAVYELLIEHQEPPKVIIDEAVELAKEFGNDSSSGFVNGVLGTILKTV